MLGQFFILHPPITEISIHIPLNFRTMLTFYFKIFVTLAFRMLLKHELTDSRLPSAMSLASVRCQRHQGRAWTAKFSAHRQPNRKETRALDTLTLSTREATSRVFRSENESLEENVFQRHVVSAR